MLVKELRKDKYLVKGKCKSEDGEYGQKKKNGSETEEEAKKYIYKTKVKKRKNEVVKTKRSKNTALKIGLKEKIKQVPK